MLPLENLSSDPNEEFFAEGMTDELITNLAKIGSLRVISRTSVMRYRGTHQPVPEIARELGVDGLVEGTIVRSNGRVRITAQLIQASSDRHLWAEQYEGELRDVLVLQDEVARAIAESIHVRLSSREQAQLSTALPVSPESEDLYWKGIYFLNKFNTPAFKSAREYFQQMATKNPGDPRAWSGLAMADHYLAIWGDYSLFEPAKEEALKAIDLDAAAVEPRAELAMMTYEYDWNLPEAERQFRRAIEMRPNYARSHYYYGLFLSYTVRPQEALQEFEIARRLDPLSVVMAANTWHAYYAARQYDRAIQVVQDALKMDPYFASGHYRLSLSWEQKGEYDKAIDEGLLYYYSRGDDRRTFEPRFAALRRALALHGPQGYWRQRIQDKLDASDPETQFGADGLATIYMNLNERERALESIEKGIRMHNPHTIMWTPIIPVFDPIRSDPRYKKIFAGLGLPAADTN